MRIAGNKLVHLLQFFSTELRERYPLGEVEAITRLAVHHYLGYSATEMLTRQNDNLNQSDVLKLYDCAKALASGIPIQYVLGTAEFHGLKFKVDERVLIPRPETEELVELVLKENEGAFHFLDIGTGSGCIPIVIQKNRPLATGFACDISVPAVQLATTNAENNAVPLSFFIADVLAEDLPVQTDVIVSNPPYIMMAEKHTIATTVTNHEPHLALFVNGDDDIVFYKRIIDHCTKSLRNGGRLYFELNPLTADKVQAYAQQSGIFEKTILVKDLSGVTRFLKAYRAL